MQATPARPALLVVALSLGVTTLSLLQSLVVPVLGVIATQLGVSPGAAGWVLTANLLAAAVLTPVLGRLGDLQGERPVMLAILVAVVLGTLLTLLATSLPLLLVGRVLQGASYGLFPLAISVLRREVPGAGGRDRGGQRRQLDRPVRGSGRGQHPRRHVHRGEPRPGDRIPRPQDRRCDRVRR